MSRYLAYLRNAAELVNNYNGGLPLAVYLKQFFALNKKFGSNDRKQVSALCYQYFRAGHLTQKLTVEDAILQAAFLCNNQPVQLLNAMRPEWDALIKLSVPDKLKAIGVHWDAGVHTPWNSLLQKETGTECYALSHFYQPDLFLRVRPGKEKIVGARLLAAGIPFQDEGQNCLRLPNGSRLDNLFELNREVVVQDKSSQQCGKIIKEIIPGFSGLVWDACAASGGKSIMLTDLYPGQISLAVSDIRQSILANLKERFRAAGILGYRMFETDLSENAGMKNLNFKADMILADVPCTGSGTWARTPEQHYFFKPESADDFAATQFAICRNTVKNLKSGGYYIYITCSVFEKENRNVCERISNELNLTLLQTEIIDGTRERSDSMFLSVFTKP